MRILHTSDWHIGRTFHGHPTLEHLRLVLAALVGIVRERKVDVVVVAGDIFDSATPAAENYEVLTEALHDLREAGATVVLTSGNHDSATRLGFQSSFAALAGIHVITRPEELATPVEVTDEHGPVAVYGIPFLEPALVRHRLGDDASHLRTHADVLGFAMNKIRADVAARQTRSIVLAHCFAAQPTNPATAIANPEAAQLTNPAAALANPAAALTSPDATEIEPAPTPGETVEQTPGLERDITAGGLDLVPLNTFDGPDYVALGHIHGRATLRPNVRYSGAPLHYTFSEADKPRGVWFVELGADGLSDVEWVDLPVPRRLRVLTGSLEALLDDQRFSENEQDWVSAVITDQARPLDAMRKLQARYRWCATLEHRPDVVATDTPTSYAERLHSKTDSEIVGGFLEHVRNGVGATESERALIASVVSDAAALERAS